jgi:hypothetical protein
MLPPEPGLTVGIIFARASSPASRAMLAKRCPRCTGGALLTAKAEDVREDLYGEVAPLLPERDSGGNVVDGARSSRPLRTIKGGRANLAGISWSRSRGSEMTRAAHQ